MRQAQFDQLLAWTTLNALYSAELLMQTRLKRELTQDELEQCHKQAHQTANVMRDMFADNRKSARIA